MRTVQKAILAAAVGLLSTRVAHAQTQVTPGGNTTSSSPSAGRPTSPANGANTPTPAQTRRPRDDTSQGQQANEPIIVPGAITPPSSLPRDTVYPNPPAEEPRSAPQAAPATTGSEDMEQPSAKRQQSARDVSLSFSQKQEVQVRLSDDGHYDGEIDGIVGARTRSGLRSFQREHQLTASGRMTKATLDAMGIVVNDKNRVAAAGAQGAIGATNSVQLSSLGEEPTRVIQRKLQDLGYYRGEVDGIAGPATRRALRAFYQAQADLGEKGKLWADSASVFDLNASDVEPVRGQGEATREPSGAKAAKKPADQGDK